MNTRQLIFSFALVDYLAFTAWAAYASGWSGITSTVASPTGLQMTAELLLFFALGATFVFRDAKSRSLSPAWAGLVVCTGVAGLLAYLIRREGGPASAHHAHPALA